MAFTKAQLVKIAKQHVANKRKMQLRDVLVSDVTKNAWGWHFVSLTTMDLSFEETIVVSRQGEIIDLP